MNDLIKINKKSGEKASIKEHFTTPPVFKLFLFGTIATLCASGILGNYLWLALKQNLPLTSNYSIIKSFHSHFQFYYFIGIFIQGFLYQAGPKLFQIKQNYKNNSYLSLYLHAISLLLLLADFVKLSKMALLGSYLLLIITIIRWSIQLNKEKILTIAIPTTSGLIALSYGIFINLTEPLNGLFLFWFGVCPILFVTGQQFITGFLGGKWLQTNEYTLCATFYLLTLICVLTSLNYASQDSFFNSNKTLYGICGLISSFIYFYKTGALYGVFKNLTNSINLAFLSAIIWLNYGLIGITFNISTYDQVLHQWGIGVATTLIFALGVRIIGFIASSKFFNERLLYYLILLLQIIIIFRTTNILLFNLQTLMVTSLTLVIFLAWTTLVIRRSKFF